jgi:hypothetical protein
MSDAPELLEILNVEILRTGRWNDDVFERTDLDELVLAAGEVGYRVPITLGHRPGPGAPAAGWISNVRRAGDRLLADFVALPRKVFDAIKQRAYDSASVEIFVDLHRNNRVFRRALKAVALLGAEIPAVDLPPLSSFLAQLQLQSARVATYDLRFFAVDPRAAERQAELEGRPSADEINTSDGREAGDLLMRRAKAIAGDDPAKLPAAWRQARSEYGRLASIYDANESDPPRVTRNVQVSATDVGLTPSEQIDRLVRARKFADSRRSYREHLLDVLRADGGALARAYFQS